MFPCRVEQSPSGLVSFPKLPPFLQLDRRHELLRVWQHLIQKIRRKWGWIVNLIRAERGHRKSIGGEFKQLELSQRFQGQPTFTYGPGEVPNNRNKVFP